MRGTLIAHTHIYVLYLLIPSYTWTDGRAISYYQVDQYQYATLSSCWGIDLSSHIFNVKTVKNNLNEACLCSLVWYHIRYGRFVCASFTKNTHRHYHYPRNILRLTIYVVYRIWISNNRKFSFKLSTQTDVQTKIHSQLTNTNISTHTHSDCEVLVVRGWDYLNGFST